jgi:hypothetical protein
MDLTNKYYFLCLGLWNGHKQSTTLCILFIYPSNVIVLWMNDLYLVTLGDDYYVNIT